jgi:hypothetical protein
MARTSRGKGRVLAVKWGLNPNSSSLGVDVTFLLFGAAAVSLLTPLVGALVRWRRGRRPGAPGADATEPRRPGADATEPRRPSADATEPTT